MLSHWTTGYPYAVHPPTQEAMAVKPWVSTVALRHFIGGPWWSHATQGPGGYLEELSACCLLPVEEKPKPQDVDDDHQQAIRLNKHEPSFRPVNDSHQSDVHHDDRPQSGERMR